jgi:hypothetical protein
VELVKSPAVRFARTVPQRNRDKRTYRARAEHLCALAQWQWNGSHGASTCGPTGPTRELSRQIIMCPAPAGSKTRGCCYGRTN